MSRLTRFLLGAFSVLNAVAAGLAITGSLRQGNQRTAATIALTLTALLAVSVAVAQGRVWVVTLVAAVSSLGLGAVTGRLAFGAIVAFGLLLLAVWWLSRAAVVPTSLAVATDSDPKAQGIVAEFEAMGYVASGGFSFDLQGGRTVPASLLIGPLAERYVVVTDLVTVITSTFGARTLVSRNSARITPPPDALANDLSGVDSFELERGHQSALEILAARGVHPDRIQGQSLVDDHLARESHWLAASFGSRRQRLEAALRTGAGEGSLEQSPSAGARIEAWLATN